MGMYPLQCLWEGRILIYTSDKGYYNLALHGTRVDLDVQNAGCICRNHHFVSRYRRAGQRACVRVRVRVRVRDDTTRRAAFVYHANIALGTRVRVVRVRCTSCYVLVVDLH